ncbi:MAG: glycosyltransferase family 39 protein [Actinobacteria bacterium]|nr:glycosyltransferase family 39 protein [Actinomycetota bacterium]
MVVSRARRIPVWIWLAAIVLGSAIFRAVIGRGIVAPFIMVDEVIWAEIARGIADAGEPLVRGDPDPGYGIVYPLLVSPAYALFESLPDAYAALKAVNAVAMSLAAIPAYFLARRVVGEGLSLLGALLAVAIPSLAYTGTVMTENAFYPLFLVLALVIQLMLERPTALRVVLLVALLGLAFATRVQAVAILPAVLLAPLVLEVFERRGLRATLNRFRVLYGVVVALGILVLAVQLVGGRSLQDLLGAYSPVGDASYDLGEVLRYLVWHVAELALYLLVVPVAATIVLVGRARSLDAPLRAFLAATVALTVCLVPVVAAFASVFSDRIEERNLFYLAPLFVIALLAWIDRGAPRPRVLAPVAAAVSALLVLLIPFDRFLTTSAITDTLMLLPFWSLQDRIGSGWITPAAFGLTVALGLAFLLVPTRYVVVLPLLVLGLWTVSLKPIWWGKHGFERFSRGSLFQGIRAPERDWIDRALPDDAEAAFLWTGRTDRLTVNQNEFFSRGVGQVYFVEKPTPGGLPETRVTIDRETGAVTLPEGDPVIDPYVVADSSFEPDGEALARDRGWGITLWRVRPPLVSAVRIDGLYPNDTWSGRTVTYVRRRCLPGMLAVELSSDGTLFLEPQRIVARSNGKVVGSIGLQPAAQAVLRVPLAPAGPAGRCRVVFAVTPTEVPSRVSPGSGDDRELGAHFNRFVYTPRK